MSHHVIGYCCLRDLNSPVSAIRHESLVLPRGDVWNSSGRGRMRAFTIAQLLGHSDVRVTMRYVRTVEESKRAAVDAVQLNSRKKCPRIGHMEQTATDGGGCESLKKMVEQRGLEPLASALRTRRSAKLSYCPTRMRIQFQVSAFKFQRENIIRRFCS